METSESVTSLDMRLRLGVAGVVGVVGVVGDERRRHHKAIGIAGMMLLATYLAARDPAAIRRDRAAPLFCRAPHPTPPAPR